MAQLVTIRLSRQDAQPWGFRLQGGKDFATPLVVQKVNGGSLAEQAGLIPGDSVIKINSTEVFNLKHKDAQDVIVRSGNNFEVTIQRGGSTWRPTVTPTGPLPKHGNQIVPTVTKTSLAHKPQEVRHSGSGFNSAARPFSAVNGSDGQVKSIVNKQYNTPVGIYSEEAIAETLSAQAEVLAGGVLGVNFKKNEKVYNAANSEVLKMLQEQECDQPEPAERSHGSLPYFNQSAQPAYNVQPQAPQQHHIPVQHVQHSPSAPSVTRHVSAPLAQPKAPSTGGLPAGQNICSECDRLIVGVFVRIKDKNLHAECFKCSTCGASLKNQGYFNLNNKLYCDIHAKLAALNNPPPGTEGYAPVPIKPNQKLGASTISAALNAHNLQTNGSTHSPFTSPTSNHDPGLAAITPIQVSHSRTSSSSSSVGTANSCISSLSPNISPSPEKLSPAHSRQSSGSGSISGGGGIQGLGPFLPQSLKTTTIATVTSATAPSASPTIATVGNTMNINETTTINHRQNENDMNSSNRNGTNGTGGSYIIPQANTYNQFLKEYSNKKANDQATTDVGYKSSMPDVNTAANMTSAVNFTNGQYTTETSEPIYGTIRADAKIQPNEDFQYITLTGSIIKSVIPPGKGIKTNYKVNQGYSGPKPFNASPSNPPISGPKSPSSYPPPSNAPSWSQPSAPKPATNPYATLPRASAPSAPASQGRFSTYKPSSGPTGFSKEIRETLEQNYEYHKAENHFEDSELIEVNGKPTNSLIWPPAIDDGHMTPTASPLYIAPPETQHVIPKPIKRQEQHHQQQQQQQRQEIVEEQSVQQSQQIQQTQQWQSRSAPELNASRQVVEIESSSDSYTSTCTTTTTTSEEYQKMYQQQIQAYQMQQQMYEQSGSEMDYHMDMEVAAMQQQHDQAYLSSSEYMSFQSGRRSAQECAEYISGPLNTYKLIDLVREVTPSPTPPSTKGPRKVEFRDDVETKQEKPQQETEKKKEEEPKPKDAPKEEKPREAPEEDLQTQRKFQPTPEIKIEIPEPKPIPPTNIPNPVPKEWISPMVKALTTAPDKPVTMTDAQPCESPCKPVECSVVCAKTVHKEEEVKEEKKQEIKEETIEATKAEILREEPAKGSFIASVMATAPTDPVKFMPDPNDPVPLPEETEPYMPPPMDMKPYIREDFRPKSPLLNALITAPETPFEPFGHDVAAHFDDLPTPKDPTNNVPVPPPLPPAVNNHTLKTTPKPQPQPLNEATKMLTRSLEKLNVNSNEKFRVEASKVLTTMLEARLSGATLPRSAKKDTKPHPMKNVLDLCDTIQQEVNKVQKTTENGNVKPPISNKPSPNGKLQELDAPETVIFRNKRTNINAKPELTSHALDRRSYIEKEDQKENEAGNANEIQHAKTIANDLSDGKHPVCCQCNTPITRGPFITALGRIWCPDHFVCVNANCRRALQDIGFVEEKGELYCEYCFEKFLAPSCSKCNNKIKGDCLNAIGKHYHPECFTCAYCGKLFGNNPFFLEEGEPYCEADWNELFTTKCFACGFPVEAGDRWVEALNHNYHSQCFNCTACKKNLEGQSFFNKGGRPYCKAHAR